MKFKTTFLLFFLALTFLFFYKKRNKIHLNPTRQVGQVIDDLEGVEVFFNGAVGHVENRNVTKDGYNLGLRWQCVEFIKRFYLEQFNHKMPNSYGHAKDFFHEKINDGDLNRERNLIQYTNPSRTKPEQFDILIFDGTTRNPYGHVAIISKVMKNEIEIIQQNMGQFGSSREKLKLSFDNRVWEIKNRRVLGRLGLEE